MDYKQKYLKYKTKYLQLVELQEGGGINVTKLINGLFDLINHNSNKDEITTNIKRMYDEYMLMLKQDDGIINYIKNKIPNLDNNYVILIIKILDNMTDNMSKPIKNIIEIGHIISVNEKKYSSISSKYDNIKNTAESYSDYELFLFILYGIYNLIKMLRNNNNIVDSIIYTYINIENLTETTQQILTNPDNPQQILTIANPDNPQQIITIANPDNKNIFCEILFHILKKEYNITN